MTSLKKLSERAEDVEQMAERALIDAVDDWTRAFRISLEHTARAVGREEYREIFIGRMVSEYDFATEWSGSLVSRAQHLIRAKAYATALRVSWENRVFKQER